MEKKKSIDPLQFDKRVMQRFVTSGKMTSKDVEHHLEALPDLAEKCEDISEVVYEHFNDGDGHDNSKQ